MARIPLIEDKSQLAQEHHGIFDAIAASRGFVGGPFPLLLHDPVLAQRVAELGHHIRFESPISEIEQKLVILVVAAELHCRYLSGYQTPLARKLGVSDALIAAIENKTEPSSSDDHAFSDHARALIAYSRLVVRGQDAGPDLFAAMESRYGTRGHLMLTATIGYYTMLGQMMNAFDIRPK
jgi:4-carboxymuconolactone decarboxylase